MSQVTLTYQRFKNADFFSFYMCCFLTVACGLSFPNQLLSLHWEHGVLTTGPRVQPRDPSRPWRGTLASGHKPRWGLLGLQSLESNPQLSSATRMEDWTCPERNHFAFFYPSIYPQLNELRTRSVSPVLVCDHIFLLFAHGWCFMFWVVPELPLQFLVDKLHVQHVAENIWKSCYFVFLNSVKGEF